MRIRTTCVLFAVMPLLASCASQPIALAPVGPSPVAGGAASTDRGYLRVFSEREPVIEGFDQGANPLYYQHSDYRIYDRRGRLVKYVGNTVGRYDPAPRLVSLPPGSYTVEARAKDYLFVKAPVVIERGRTTRVHLDDQWKPPAGTPKNQLVFEPAGCAVGWRAKSNRQRCTVLSTSR